MVAAVTRLDDGNAILFTWDAVAATDTGTPVQCIEMDDMCVAMVGTFGGSVTLEGSNDGSAYSTLTDPQGSAISKSANGVSQVGSIPRYVRPKGGAGVSSVVVTLYGHRLRKH